MPALREHTSGSEHARSPLPEQTVRRTDQPPAQRDGLELVVVEVEVVVVIEVEIVVIVIVEEIVVIEIILEVVIVIEPVEVVILEEVVVGFVGKGHREGVGVHGVDGCVEKWSEVVKYKRGANPRTPPATTPRFFAEGSGCKLRAVLAKRPVARC